MQEENVNEVKTVEQPVDKTMYEQLVELVNAMLKDGFDFKTQAGIFKWKYEDHPNIVYELAIYDDSFLDGEITEEFDGDDLVNDWKGSVH